MDVIGPGGGYGRGNAGVDAAADAASDPGDSSLDEAEAATAASPASPPSPPLPEGSGAFSWTRVATPRVLSGIAKLLYACGALGVLAGLTGDSGFFFAFSAFVSMLAWPLFLLSYILSSTQTHFPARLELSDAALSLVMPNGKRRMISRRQITSALVVERPQLNARVPTVEIHLASGDVLTARFPDPRTSEAVVHALGFGAGARRVKAVLARPVRRLIHPFLALAAWFAASTVIGGATALVDKITGTDLPWYAAVHVFALGAYVALLRLVRDPEVTVGDDGVLVHASRRRRFVPTAAIASVAATGGTLVIETHDGGRIPVRGMFLDPGRLKAIARAVRERLVHAAAAPDRMAHYERGSRDLPAWREHLARGLDASSYRVNPATIDEAESVLRSPVATAEQRVGAALALRVAGEPRERIRVALDAVAHEPTRDALLAAEEDDDAQLEKALRRLSLPE